MKHNPSCEKCGATMYKKMTSNGEYWFCCDRRCGSIWPVVWAA